MAANTAPIFEAVPRVQGTSFAPGDTTTKKTIFTAGANGTRVDSITITQNSGGTVNVDFYHNDGATDFFWGSIAIPNNTGYVGNQPIECMPTIAAQIGYYQVPNGHVLKAACDTTLAANILTILVKGGDY